MKKSIYSFFGIIAITAIMFSCAEDAAPPVVEMFFTVDVDDPYTIHFTTIDENVKTYSWDFGDMEMSTEAAPSHTYGMSGDYTAKVTVKGDGGEAIATKEINIAASIGEILSGGPAMPNGKKWKLATTITATDGAGLVSDVPNNVFPLENNILFGFGLGEEYDNTYTVKHDGTFSVDPVNGTVLSGAVYAEVGAQMDPPWHSITIVPTSYDIMMVGISHTPAANATWEIKQGDLTVSVKDDPDPIFSGSPDVRQVTFTDATWLEITNSYFGVMDFTQYCIIRDITADKMQVSMLLHTNGPGYDAEFMQHPSVMVTITFEAVD